MPAADRTIPELIVRAWTGDTDAFDQDIARFMPLSILLVAGVLVWSFRTVRGVVVLDTTGGGSCGEVGGAKPVGGSCGIIVAAVVGAVSAVAGTAPGIAGAPSPAFGSIGAMRFPVVVRGSVAGGTEAEGRANGDVVRGDVVVRGAASVDAVVGLLDSRGSATGTIPGVILLAA